MQFDRWLPLTTLHHNPKYCDLNFRSVEIHKHHTGIKQQIYPTSWKAITNISEICLCFPCNSFNIFIFLYSYTNVTIVSEVSKVRARLDVILFKVIQYSVAYKFKNLNWVMLQLFPSQKFDLQLNYYFVAKLFLYFSLAHYNIILIIPSLKSP
jgi:hypothetical protein